MKISGLQPQTLIDYPGKLACTIFTQGCNFRCEYCHNSDIVIENGRNGRKKDDVLKFLKERKYFLNGVCITGGEPTLNKDLPDFIRRIKKLGFLIKLDTNGTNPKMLKQLIDDKVIDYIAMDIKSPLEKYDSIANVEVKKDDIQKSVNIIKKFSNYEFRTTVVPGLFNEEDAKSIGKWLKGSKRFYIQQFRGIKTINKEFMNKPPFTKNELIKFCNIMKPYFEKCSIRGI